MHTECERLIPTIHPRTSFHHFRLLSRHLCLCPCLLLLPSLLPRSLSHPISPVLGFAGLPPFSFCQCAVDWALRADLFWRLRRSIFLFRGTAGMFRDKHTREERGGEEETRGDERWGGEERRGEETRRGKERMGVGKIALQKVFIYLIKSTFMYSQTTLIF